MKKLWLWWKRRALAARARMLAEHIEHAERQRALYALDVERLVTEAHAVREQLFWLDSGCVLEAKDGRLFNVPHRARRAGL